MNTGGNECLLVDRIQAAGALAISVRKLAELTTAGRVPCVRIGRRVLYSLKALASWVEAQCRQPEGA